MQDDAVHTEVFTTKLLEAGTDKTADNNPGPTLGDELRELRRERGLKLVELAGQLGRSVGWLSQVERGISTPTGADLQQLSRILDAPIARFYRQVSGTSEKGRIVRHADRRQVVCRVTGVREEVLSPDMDDGFVVTRVLIEPGSERVDPIRRHARELGTIVAGRLIFWIDDKRFELETGDTFRLRGETFFWSNPYDTPCVVIWAMSPPTF